MWRSGGQAAPEQTEADLDDSAAVAADEKGEKNEIITIIMSRTAVAPLQLTLTKKNEYVCFPVVTEYTMITILSF